VLTEYANIDFTFTNVCPIPSMTWVFEMMMFLEGEPTAKFGQVVS
jgi:hypothetical protein